MYFKDSIIAVSSINNMLYFKSNYLVLQQSLFKKVQYFLQHKLMSYNKIIFLKENLIY